MLNYIIALLSCFTFFISFNVFASSPLIAAKKGMVVTDQHLASQVGASVLRAGGNAIDAAVAVGYALAVVNPCCGNIGGGGFMTIHLANGKDVFLNFRERAPLAANLKLFMVDGKVIPEKSNQGYLAVAVPGTVLGLETVLKKYGTLSRQELMAPAIALAEKGFILQPGDITILQRNTDLFQTQANVAAIFLKNNHPFQVGERLIQTDLARTLKIISDKGSDAFYKGQIAKAVVAASKKNGGILSLKDFSHYFVEELQPLRCYYRGYTFITAPPPSAGGVTLCETLNILEGFPLKTFGQYQSKGVYYIVEAMGLGFHDRNTKLGDPDFVKNPVAMLTSKEYANQLRQHIPAFEQTVPQKIYFEKQKEGVNTTHYSIMDKQGNAVSVTYTLNSYFGAHVIAGNTGFFLNNEMDDFAIGDVNQFGLRQGDKNKIEPGKRPLSSMTPTIIFNPIKTPRQPNTIFMILGSPGGPRIISATLLTILNVIDYGMNIQDAVNAPRLHYQGFPNTIFIEPNTLSAATSKELMQRHFDIQTQPQWSAVEAIYYDANTQHMIGANDIRRPAGAAIGVDTF